MKTPSDVTLAKDAIHNPGEPRHFMGIKPVKGELTVFRGDTPIAVSRSALRVIEIGRGVYDPVYYVPVADLTIPLSEVTAKSTHCPLKGDARYLEYEGAELCWEYDRPLDIAVALKGHVAFWPGKVWYQERPDG